MKKIAITLFLVLGSLTIQSQELTWQTDMNKALEISKKSQKPLFLFFTGSDWCGWCIRLQKEVFKTPEFAKWAKDNVILVELDFPRSTPQQPEIKKYLQYKVIQQFGL
jgi:protein disulfide-isomerase